VAAAGRPWPAAGAAAVGAWPSDGEAELVDPEVWVLAGRGAAAAARGAIHGVLNRDQEEPGRLGRSIQLSREEEGMSAGAIGS
jgi:hypothetical protein